jgi:hypothetical protein
MICGRDRGNNKWRAIESKFPANDVIFDGDSVRMLFSIVFALETISIFIFTFAGEMGSLAD